MSFGRNPHVSKAEAAEQKALCARDGVAREQAWREAARQWERANEREVDEKRRQEYAARAEAARAQADGRVESAETSEVSPDEPLMPQSSIDKLPEFGKTKDKKPVLLN